MSADNTSAVIISTTETIPGRPHVEVYGLCTGNPVRANDLGHSYDAGATGQAAEGEESEEKPHGVSGEMRKAAQHGAVRWNAIEVNNGMHGVDPSRRGFRIFR